MTRQQRLLKKLNFVKEKQQSAVNSKYRNILELKELETAQLFFSEPSLDVFSKQLSFFDLNDEWSFSPSAFFDEIPLIVSDSLSNS